MTAYTNLTGSPGVWKIIESPSVLAQYRSRYTINSTGIEIGDILTFMQKSFNMEKIIILCRPLQFIETPLL